MESIWREVHGTQLLIVDALSLPGGRAVLRLAGALDVASCGQLRDALDAQLREGRTWLVLDMAGLSFIDSSGLSVLIAFSKKAADAGGQLSLAALQPHPAKILKTADVERRLAIYPGAADAPAGPETADAGGAP